MTLDVICADCGDVIDVCAFCEHAGCSSAICFACLRFGLGESKPELRDLEA